MASPIRTGTFNAGESYVVFGSSGGFAASLDLSALDGTNGFRLDGIDGSDQSGVSVSGAGDVNGDGIADLIIGARFADPDGKSLAGESYVVFGSSGGLRRQPGSLRARWVQRLPPRRLDGDDQRLFGLRCGGCERRRDRGSHHRGP